MAVKRRERGEAMGDYEEGSLSSGDVNQCVGFMERHNGSPILDSPSNKR